jgi:hypothetical protein
VAAETDPAPHVPLEREEDPLVRNAALAERVDREVDHHLGTADERPHGVGAKVGLRDELRYDSHPPEPGRVRGVDRDLDRELVTPAVQLVRVEQILRRARAVEHRGGAVLGPVRERVEHDRAERSKPDPARDHEHVAARSRLDGPAVAEGAA